MTEMERRVRRTKAEIQAQRETLEARVADLESCVGKLFIRTGGRP
jgi:hypothetical protein